jgi:uncharacterized membrane protein YphA (DoxX/SURF4 family)
MPHQRLTRNHDFAALVQLSDGLIRTGRRLRRPPAATSAAEAGTIDFIGGLLMLIGVLVQIAADVSPATAQRVGEH